MSVALAEGDASGKRGEIIARLLKEVEQSGKVPPHAVLGLTFRAPNAQGKITDHVVYATPDTDGEDFDDPDDGF